ncbi:MFS transporter [Paractinoplanes ferrugineus]|uniref:MFS transporter n=1 Tax=Paractinoplanes ferrugineus TaxID=113564 RepID=A0A919J0L7_9ACTN|nr:MFS transporter [Actinoplanes ferrugineus]GIE10224.1 MFS transporter [Actinoplanes ferrugineus]
MATTSEQVDWRADFRRRWAAFAAGEVGSALGYSALPIVAVLVLGASDFQVSLLTVLAGLVSAGIALPLGPWIEHHRKLPVMVASDLLRFAAVVSVPVAAVFDVLTYWHLCVVAVVQTAARLAFDSAGVAQLRTLVPEAHRAEANGKFETTLWTANAAGPPLGGVLISWLGATATMVLDAVSFLVSALTLRGLRVSEPVPPQRTPERHWRRDLTAGWRYIQRHRGLAALFWNSMIFGGCVMALVPLLTVFVLRDLGLAAWQFGLVTGLSSGAGILGSMLVKPLRERLGEHRVLLLGGVGRNLWMFLIPFAPGNLVGLIMLTAAEFLMVLFAGMFSPTFATYRMNATDDAHMSRVVLAWAITNKVVQPVFIAAAGALAVATSARTALLVLAGLLLTGVVFLPWRRDRAATPSR